MDFVLTHWRKLWLCYNYLCSIFNESTQPFDFIKRNVIRKLPYKAKYISEGLFMFPANSGIRFFNLVALIVNNMERIDTRKRNKINIVQFSVLV